MTVVDVCQKCKVPHGVSGHACTVLDDSQMCRILNRDTPRPGETFQLFVGNRSNEGVTIESVMPGALDFERGIVKVDFQLWPFFQALDLDHIITGAEVRISCGMSS